MKAGFKWVPVIDEDLCTGCGACVEACGPKCLGLEDRVAVLFAPDRCGSEEHCIAPCPTACIEMKWVAMDGDQKVGQWKQSLTGITKGASDGKD